MLVSKYTQKKKKILGRHSKGKIRLAFTVQRKILENCLLHAEIYSHVSGDRGGNIWAVEAPSYLIHVHIQARRLSSTTNDASNFNIFTPTFPLTLSFPPLPHPQFPEYHSWFFFSFFLSFCHSPFRYYLPSENCSSLAT